MCRSVTGCRWKRFDLEPRYAISLATEHYKLEKGVGGGGSLGASHGTGYRQEQWPTGGTVLNYIRQLWRLTCCELQLAKQLDSREDIR